MNTPKLAAALNTLSLALGEVAEALIDANGQIPVSAPTTPPSPVSAAPSPTDDPLGPWEPQPTYESVPLPADSPGLGRCPSHNLAWTVKAAGVSKAGKNYNSFWKCDGKTDGVFCNKKPTQAWAEAHPL